MRVRNKENHRGLFDISKKSNFRTFTALLAALTTTVVLAGCSGLLPKEEDVLAPPLVQPKEVAYATMEVTLGDIVKSTKASATMMSLSQYSLSFEARGGYLRAIHVSPGDTVTKGAILAELDGDSVRYELEKQKLALKKLEINYDRQNQKYMTLKDKNQKAIKADPSLTQERLDELEAQEEDAQAALDIAAIDLELGRLQVESLEIELSKTVILSPIDGEVIYAGKFAVGEYIGARSTLFTVADPSRLYAVYTGSEAYSFELGKKVIVTDSKTKAEYTGEVVMSPSMAPKDIIKDKSDVCVISVEGAEAGDELAIGRGMTVEMIMDEKSDVIVLPRKAIQQYAGEVYVKVLVDGVKQERVVTTGIQTTTDVEVTAGLEVGEIVILN